MKIQVTFDKPTGGYWDGGKKTGGVFTPDPSSNLSENHVAFGSWELNHFFNVKKGRSDKETLSRAIRYLKTHVRVPAKVEALA